MAQGLRALEEGPILVPSTLGGQHSITYNFTFGGFYCPLLVFMGTHDHMYTVTHIHIIK